MYVERTNQGLYWSAIGLLLVGGLMAIVAFFLQIPATTGLTSEQRIQLTLASEQIAGFDVRLANVSSALAPLNATLPATAANLTRVQNAYPQTRACDEANRAQLSDVLSPLIVQKMAALLAFNATIGPQHALVEDKINSTATELGALSVTLALNASVEVHAQGTFELANGANATNYATLNYTLETLTLAAPDGPRLLYVRVLQGQNLTIDGAGGNTLLARNFTPPIFEGALEGLDQAFEAQLDVFGPLPLGERRYTNDTRGFELRTVSGTFVQDQDIYMTRDATINIGLL